MGSNVKPVPDGYHTLTPYLYVRGAAKALDFYAGAFGAQEVYRMPGPGGAIMHAETRVGDSVLMVADENPAQGARSPEAYGGTPASVFLYVPDVDAVFAKATTAGAKVLMPPTDMFWGDRFGKLKDPFGHEWGVATHVEDVPPEEMEKRMAEMGAATPG
jgi:PhnB protein